MKSLLHLTINTGHIRRSPRSEVSDDVMPALARLVAAGGGEIPAPGGYDVEITRNGRDAVFTVSLAGRPIVTCGLAVEDSAPVWRALLALLPAAGDAGQAAHRDAVARRRPSRERRESRSLLDRGLRAVPRMDAHRRLVARFY